MNTFYGISITDDGSFICAAVHNGSRGWRKGTVRRWSCGNRIRNYLLLHKTIQLALPGHWVREQPDDLQDKVAARTGDSFTVGVNQSEFDHFTELVANNCGATYPDDAFLATIPLYFQDNPRDSFIAVSRINGGVRIGIVLKKQLITALSCRCQSAECLLGHLERLRYYVQSVRPNEDFPTTIHALTKLPFDLPPEAATVDCGTDDPDVLKAIGVALCGVDQLALPRLGGSRPETDFRPFRLPLLAAAAALLLLSVAFSSVLFIRSSTLAGQVDAARNSYRNLLENNTDIRQLISTGDSLSRKVFQLNKQVAHPSRWAPFLHLLGTKRPDGLFLERMGSEPVTGTREKVRVALGGWCNNETIATDFIKVLSESPLLTDVTLSSMERVGNDKTVCRFKIICILLIK